MKILRKGDEFMKMPHSTIEDAVKIEKMIENGWKFSPKKAYKDFYKAEKTATEVKAEVKAEKKEKVKEKKEKSDYKDSKKKKK